MNSLNFIPSEPYTIGVELELQLLDAKTMDLVPVGPDLLKQVPASLKERIKAEFIRSMVEICTGVCPNTTKVEEELIQLYKLTEQLAHDLNARIYAASLHPFALVRNRHISPIVRYNELMDDLQMAGRRLISQALHVHVGLTDAETAVRICDTIRPFLPILLALTTSSPFFENEDSGFFSYRTNLFKALPRSGLPETLGTWHNFREQIILLNEATLLNNIRELWWDVRPHPDFGTVEIRICDLPSRLEDILSLVALIQSLVITLSKKEFDLPPFREVMLNNKWHASRYGLDGTYISPRRGEHKTFRQAAKDLLELVKKSANEHGAAKHLNGINAILQRGTSAHAQKEFFARHKDFTAMINEQIQDFWQ